MLSLKTRSVIEKSKDCLGLSWCREGVGISLWWETNAIGQEGLGVIFWLALALNSLNSKTEPSSMSSWAGPEDVLLSTSLATFLDKKLLVLLRDGRKLMGLLRSFDQFANVVLEGACERVIVGDLYCDIPLGLYIIRGENVVLIGELDLDKEELPVHMTLVSVEEIRSAQKAENDATNLMGSIRKRVEFLDFD